MVILLVARNYGFEITYAKAATTNNLDTVKINFISN
jgi:hypothetical protein